VQFHTGLEQSELKSRLQSETQLLEILETLVCQYSVVKRGFDFILKQEHCKVQQIKEYLHAYSSCNPSLEQLSQLCGISPFHLTRLFREAVGLPPHAYLTHLRIAQAKQQLCQSNSLAQIAIDTGFTDQSHFTKTFKAWVGVTPGQYRRQIHTK
jgi:AraC-like DNA-binding protein